LIERSRRPPRGLIGCYNPQPLLAVRRFYRHMLLNYVPILIFLGVAGALGMLLVGLGFLFGPRKPNAEKLSAYECGFEAFTDARMKFDVRYYLVAILFIVFDLEIAFLFPWAVSLGGIGMVGLIAMGIFLFILVVGFIYEWKKGALEWD
jgi:NADH-quinone oxidoreductase subunit A